jgi:hypothetical protein
MPQLKLIVCFLAKYRPLVVRLGHKRSMDAIAHKMPRIIHKMLKDKVEHGDNTVGHNKLLVKKNSARWIKNPYERSYISKGGVIQKKRSNQKAPTDTLTTIETLKT